MDVRALWLLAVISIVPRAALGAGGGPSLSHCAFTPDGARSSGSCDRILAESRRVTLTPERAMLSGAWNVDRTPTAMWVGNMSDRRYGDDRIELESYDDGTGVLRTEFGWYAVSNVKSSPDLSFDVDSSREVAPNDTDVRIVERAAQVLASDDVWNRADNRRCPASATTWSIYCAMDKAAIDVTGGFHHRRPALEVVREVIEDRTASRNYPHRLMDYNNDPATHLSDVQSAFSEALERMKDAAWLRSHGFA